MAKRKIELFTEITTNRELKTALKKNPDKLICAEIYNSFSGPCTALDKVLSNIKLNLSSGELVLLRILADEIDVFERHRSNSEPLFMFIMNKKIIKQFRGVHSIMFTEVAKQEIDIYNKWKEGFTYDRPTYELDETTPEEKEYFEAQERVKIAEDAVKMKRIEERQAQRKRHRAQLMAPHLGSLNFVLFWPHARHAHVELYERWDMNDIIMVGREDLQLDEEKAKDILYAGDHDAVNEASLAALLNGSALAICFRLLDDTKNFVSLVRHILYEYIPPIDDSKPINEQKHKLKTAFNIYKTISPTREQVWKNRHENTKKKRLELLEKRARRLSEMQRLARQAIEDKLEERKLAKETKKIELLKAGNLKELDKLKEEPDDDEVSIIIPEELPEPMVEILSEEENEDEYFPPPGLVIPGFYSPPNEVAKANGLAILFPKMVSEYVTPQSEYLPPHVLVLLHVSKRFRAIHDLARVKDDIITMGIFTGSIPNSAIHLAYTVNEYNLLQLPGDDEKIYLALMVSTLKDLPLLLVMDLAPEHVSRNNDHGKEECAALFPVDYGDDYTAEDFFAPIVVPEKVKQPSVVIEVAEIMDETTAEEREPDVIEADPEN